MPTLMLAGGLIWESGLIRFLRDLINFPDYISAQYEVFLFSQLQYNLIHSTDRHLFSSSYESENESCSVMSDSLQPHGLYNPWNSPGYNTGVGSLSLLQVIFPTKGSNSGLPHCGQILYQLSQKWSPRILEWVASRFFTNSAVREAL